MSKVFALIINSLFGALPTHQRSPGAIRLSKKSLLRISTVELPITPASYSSPSSHLLLQNPSQSGTSRRAVDGGAFSRGPDLLLSARCHRFNSVSVQGGRRPSRDALHLCCVCEARLLIHCTVVLFKVALKRLILCKEPLFAAALSRRGCRARRPPVMLLYLLNNACKHSGNAFSSRSIVVISHVGSLPPFAFSSSAAVAGRPGGSG